MFKKLKLLFLCCLLFTLWSGPGTGMAASAETGIPAAERPMEGGDFGYMQQSEEIPLTLPQSEPGTGPSSGVEDRAGNTVTESVYSPEGVRAGLADDGDYIEVEAAPEDISIIVEGPRKQINYIDESLEGITDYIALYTNDFGDQITVPRTAVGVQVDQNNQVLQVINQSINGGVPNWTGPTDLPIPPGGYVLVANDDSWANKTYKQYLAKNFRPGDIIKLRKNGEVVPVTELMTGQGPKARLVIDNDSIYTVTVPSVEITGKVTNRSEDASYSLTINGQQAGIQADDSFRHVYSLATGVNYIDVQVSKNGSPQAEQTLIIYYKASQNLPKEVYLWVDQGSNAVSFQTSESVRDMLVKAKDAGVTSVLFDVKGVEGFASYKRNDLTGRPYVSEMTAPTRAGANPDLDLLDEFVRHGHDLGLTVHAAFNVFAEGSFAHNEFAVLNDHLDWEEHIYRAEDNGEIKRLRESKYGQSGALVAFINPANDDARRYQLLGFEEVLKNYDVDGVLLDRGRYDNFFADFSEESRTKFEAFLAARGKTLKQWPQDIFQYAADGSRINGPLIADWWEFRSATIESFTAEVRGLVDRYSEMKGKDIQASAYVGSWYESYYLNGVNWASPNFRYDPRLGFPEDYLYTDTYYETGYTDNLDFLIIGTYQTTAKQIEKYITLGNILTNGDIPLYAGMALSNLQDPALQREVFQAGLHKTNGLMLFDYSQVNWPIIKASIEDREYVKDYQLGISHPGQPDRFIEGDYYNVNRNEDNLNVYTNRFGLSTGTNTWGVEAIVDASGQVTRVVNKTQAMTWNWTNKEPNNSLIPDGGFVISAADTSGQRTRRQLVANTYSAGDQVRSAVLRGYSQYDGTVVNRPTASIQGNVEVLGPGTASVLVNGVPATMKPDGDFTATIPLELGENQVLITVYVDGYKTNEKGIRITREGQPAHVVSLELDSYNYSLVVGETHQIEVTAVYSDGTRERVTGASFSSSHSKVIEVSGSGLATAVKPGNATVTVEYEGKQAHAKIKVFHHDVPGRNKGKGHNS
ncbi:Ig-like domain-containing protein [Paenibacillus sp. 32O-W]|uniref:Ig-like domain-containing protein n=1 Tax=Paenibacillus sp. 32O-W TaxID=1695218 RepID=UPI0011A6254C|nr:Ig-like domain-containing protein [Paenibacillus sp. 32O-W]